ncbi:hypothetical protein C3489_07795 [Streptomyces sp. Ru71]|nr:hypothetical protein C3489_07795 [Streptomyces sp. Ru71]
MSLTDAQWARIEPTAAGSDTEAGRAWRDHRQVIDAIAFNGQMSAGSGGSSAVRNGPSGFAGGGCRTRCRLPGRPVGAASVQHRMCRP